MTTNTNPNPRLARRDVVENAVRRFNNGGRALLGDWTLVRDGFILLDGDAYVVNEEMVTK